jgi:hypothetical protein
VTWVALRETGSTRYPDDEEAAVLFALKAWAIFIQQPGQEHWHCACAERDGD